MFVLHRLVVLIDNLFSLYFNWNTLYLILGQKFPTKALELSLQASVHFYEHTAPDYVSTTDDNPFCTGSNSYVDVRNCI